MFKKPIALLVWLTLFGHGWPAFSQDSQLQLEPQDRICIIGNTLADRMQHDGWLETALHARFPEHQLYIRNLGYSGDTLKTRLRSASFGSPDRHLTENRADVVVLMFGYNESFAGEAGLAEFRADLRGEIEHLRSQQYNGESAPRLVLCSPIAHENLQNRNLPEGTENNRRLAMYTEAMREVAAEMEVPFVDLFRASQQAYQRIDEPLTINGIHLTEQGNREVAWAIVQSLFGADWQPPAEQRLQEIVRAVRDKNFYWYNRYRTTDGYSIFGGRADLRFVNGQTNREVMQREMEILRVMAENRDMAIWAAAQGQEHTVDDSNTPDFIPVITNKPGSGPDGQHTFLSGDEAVERMKVLDGFQVNLFASEEMFPELINPVQMAFDTKGRLWVATWPTYPHWKPKTEMDDRLLILEDTDGDGRADECKTFARGLHNPTGFEFWGGGVIVARAPEILFLKDTDGDDVADQQTVLLHGLDTADTHHTANSFVLGPGGGLYMQEGTFHHTQVETPWGPPIRNANGAVFRYDPRKMDFRVYVTYSFANPHGHVFDRWGQDIIHDGTGSVPYHGALISGHLDFPKKHSGAPPVYNRRTRPCPATEILSSAHFPESMQDELLVQNVIGDLGILRYRISDNDSSYSGRELEPLVLSDDPNFRPVDLEFGPRGALFFTDWQNPVIGHMQHNLRDPSRDKKHGRVYRLTHKQRPLAPREQVAGLPIEQLLENLKSPINRFRYRTRIELSARDSDSVIEALGKWIEQLDPSSPDYEHHLLEGLWVHQQHNVPNRELLDRLCQAEDFRVRAAATRVLCYWRDDLDDSYALLRRSARDAHPRVRLEAARSASFLDVAEGLPVVLDVIGQPTDKYLDYVIKETLRAFPDNWKQVFVDRGMIADVKPAAAEFVLQRMSIEEVTQLPIDATVGRHLLYRPGVGEQVRGEAIKAISESGEQSEVEVLVAALQGFSDSDADNSVLYELVGLMATRSSQEMARVRPELEQMARDSNEPLLRQIGLIGMSVADQSIDAAWQLSRQSISGLIDFVSGVPLLPDPELKQAAYPKVAPLLNGLPEDLGGGQAESTVANGRFVRIELPGPRRTLTLAEVEVYSGGENVARSGSAKQVHTNHGGDAARAMDGNKNPSYSAGGQTHTRENSPDPWWELDLKTNRPIERIVIYNRREGQLGQRLDGFTLKVLDDQRRVIFEKQQIPAPETSVALEIGRLSPTEQVRMAAIDAVASVREFQEQTFQALARLIREDRSRAKAVSAIQRIPKRYWSAEPAGPLVDTLMKEINAMPAAARSSAVAVEAMQLVEALASYLPAERASEIRATLGQLGVRLIRIGTRPHRMAYDRDAVVVQAGKQLQIIFENTDMMPHNLVVTLPGAMAEIGERAEAESQRKEAIERGYVPVSSKILAATGLVQPGEEDRIELAAPKKPGIYPYVCTYPGHWRRMFGSLIVVADPEAYAKNPDQYLADQGIEIQDDLLKLNARTKTEWKLADFDDAFVGSQLPPGRSFEVGRQMFKLSSCISCHKMQGEGYEIGPDLTQDLDPKWQAREILREILDPSLKIDDKYKSQTFLLETGETISGVVVSETDKEVRLVENPLVQSDVTVIDKATIEDSKKSKVSAMPKGLLDNLTREEILDLLAYIAAKGNEQDSLFATGAER